MRRNFPWLQNPDGYYFADNVNWQNFSPIQSMSQQQPNTIATTTTIAPSTRFTFLSGTEAVATVTPPMTGYHELELCWTTTTPTTTVTTGNFKTAITPVKDRPYKFMYIPQEGKYYAMAVA